VAVDGIAAVAKVDGRETKDRLGEMGVRVVVGTRESNETGKETLPTVTEEEAAADESTIERTENDPAISLAGRPEVVERNIWIEALTWLGMVAVVVIRGMPAMKGQTVVMMPDEVVDLTIVGTHSSSSNTKMIHETETETEGTKIVATATTAALTGQGSGLRIETHQCATSATSTTTEKSEIELHHKNLEAGIPTNRTKAGTMIEIVQQHRLQQSTQWCHQSKK
jgi:hypothetical protein